MLWEWAAWLVLTVGTLGVEFLVRAHPGFWLSLFAAALWPWEPSGAIAHIVGSQHLAREADPDQVVLIAGSLQNPLCFPSYQTWRC